MTPLNYHTMKGRIFMIYNGYTLDNDPFYEDYVDYSLAIQNLEYADNAEYLKIRTLCSNLRSNVYFEASPKESITYLLMCVPFLTIEHLVTLKLQLSADAARTFVNRLGKHKVPFIRSNITNVATKEKLFYLSNEIYNVTYNSLPDIYKERRHILSYARIPAQGNFTHDTSVINLLCYLLADRRCSFFEFWWRAPISQYKKFETSIMEHMQKATINSSSNIFIPDCTMRFLEDGHIIFVEQDMSTERLNQLKTKFEAYTDYIGGYQNSNIVNLFSILVSVDTKYTTSSNKKTVSKNGSFVERTKKDLQTLQALAISYNTNSIDKLLDILDVLKLKNTMDISSVRSFTKIQHLIYKVRAITTIDVLNDLIIFLNTIKEENKKSKEDTVEAEQEKHFHFRLNTFRKLVEENHKLQNLFTLGLSLFVVDSHDFDSLPYLYIQQYKTYLPLMQVIMDRYIRFRFQYDYNPFIIHNCGGTDYVFKNAIQYHNSHKNILISFENLSYDIGAAYRIKNYLKNAELEDDYIIYFLFVESEKDAIAFWSNIQTTVQTYYNKSIYIGFILFKGANLNENFEHDLSIFDIIDGNIRYY